MLPTDSLDASVPGGRILPEPNKNSSRRTYQLGYSYEVYANPTFADLGWQALPFALTETGAIDRNIHTVPSEGTLDLYVAAAAAKGFYYVSYRVPGANTGTP